MLTLVPGGQRARALCARDRARGFGVQFLTEFGEIVLENRGASLRSAGARLVDATWSPLFFEDATWCPLFFEGAMWSWCGHVANPAIVEESPGLPHLPGWVAGTFLGGALRSAGARMGYAEGVSQEINITSKHSLKLGPN